MNVPDRDEDFFIGYLPQAPASTTRCVRPWVATTVVGAVLLGAAAAVTLPYFGRGEFDFDHHTEYRGVIRGGDTPRLRTAAADYPLVGQGKRQAPLELCGADGSEVVIRGTRIARDGRELVEVLSFSTLRRAVERSPTEEPLGRFTLTGEIVDAKCYFGVMNPGEGRSHRACAIQCLRGGLPAAFVARDAAGRTVPLLVADAEGRALNDRLLPYAGVPVSVSGEVVRQDRWLVFRLDPATLRTL